MAWKYEILTHDDTPRVSVNFFRPSTSSGNRVRHRTSRKTLSIRPSTNEISGTSFRRRAFLVEREQALKHIVVG